MQHAIIVFHFYEKVRTITTIVLIEYKKKNTEYKMKYKLTVLIGNSGK